MVQFLFSRPLAAATAHVGQPVMGTVLQVTVIADDAATAQRLAAAAIATARHWDDVLTTWRPEGELARLNAQAGTGPVAVSADLASVIAQMERFTAATGGGFDPAVGAIVRLWRRPATPTPHALAALGPHRFATAVTRQDGRVALTCGTELDAGAIGKGIAVDAIVALLRREGARAAFVNFGGSSQHAVGVPPDDPDGWRIAIAGVREGEVLGTLALRDASLSTSRAIGTAAEAGPIIDPRNGAPVPAPRLATVVAPNAATANAWSTGLIVLGRAGLARADANGVHALVGDADGVDRTTGFPLRP